MTKKVNYFSHDYSARNDAKIISLRRKTGMEGLGIFWALVEMLYENGGELSADDENLENLAYEWRCEVEKIKIVIFNCNLFVVENWKFFSKSVNERLKKIENVSERRKEAWKKWLKKRWWKNEENSKSIANAIENDSNCYENYSKSIAKPEKPIAKNSKEINKKINKKINKNTLNPLTSSEVCEESPISDKTSDKESVKSVFLENLKIEKIATQSKNTTTWGGINEIRQAETNRDFWLLESEKKKIFFKKFFEKFPKKTHEKEAEIAFLNLDEVEIREISRVFPFWLNYWANIDPFYVPNAYNWLYNKLWKNPIPTATQSHPIAVQTETELTKKIRKKQQKQKENEQKKQQQNDEKIAKEKSERQKIIEFFTQLPEEKQAEITEKVKQKFAWTPVKNGDLLWQIEIARIVKAEFEGF